MSVGVAARQRLAPLAALVVVLVVLAVMSGGNFYGGGADMAHHFAVVHWFSEHPTTARPARLLEMAYYPAGAHWLAVPVGRVLGSPFAGMHHVALVAVAAVWCAIGALLCCLPRRRAAVAVGVVTVVLLSTGPGPVELQLHGHEVIENFFFSQLVAQAAFWAAVWWTTRSLVRGASSARALVPLAVTAVLLTWVHALPALQAAALVGLLAVGESVRLWAAGTRELRTLCRPLLLPTGTGLLVLMSPGFRAMRRLSTNDGALDIPYLPGLASVTALALLVLALSCASVFLGTRRPVAGGATRHSLQVLGLAGLCIALPCLAQAAALTGGEGSAYAVKKYGFGLLTVVVVQGAALVSSIVPCGTAGRGRPPGRLAGAALVGALGLVAVTSLFYGRPATYSVASVADLDTQLSGLQDHLQTASSASKDFAVQIPEADPVLDYMLSISSLEAPRDEVASAVLAGAPLPLDGDVRFLVTAHGSPYTSAECSRAVHPRLVVTDAACFRAPPVCNLVNTLAQGGSVPPSALRGFGTAEPTGRWTDGPTARFTCELPSELRSTDLVVSIDGTAFLPPGVPRQRVVLGARGARLEVEQVPGAPAVPLVLQVPADDDPVLVVEFGLPDAISPAEAGISVDRRRLGLFVTAVRLTAAETG